MMDSDSRQSTGAPSNRPSTRATQAPPSKDGRAFDQVPVEISLFGKGADYLTEGMVLTVEFLVKRGRCDGVA
jgi:hypothetical protein